MLYGQLRKLNPEDRDLTLRLLNEIELAISDQPEQAAGSYTEILKNLREEAQPPEESIRVYYLSLMILVLDDKETEFGQLYKEFESYARRQKQQLTTGLDFWLVDSMEKKYPEKARLFQKVKSLLLKTVKKPAA